jgi:transposase
MKRTQRSFGDNFKKQMVHLYENGKKRSDLIREYKLTPSSFDRWVKQYRTTGSFRQKDNFSAEEKELIELRKEVQQLRMENDILKQAALIMGRG